MRRIDVHRDYFAILEIHCHYSDVIMGTMASQIISMTIVYSIVYSGADQRKCVTGLCAGRSPVTGEFPAQRVSNTTNVSIWWRHHDSCFVKCRSPTWVIKLRCRPWPTITTEPNMASSCNHVVPGEHVYDGIMYPGLFPVRSLDKIKSFEFRDDDVILATYPKSGEYWLLQPCFTELLVTMPKPSP